MSCAKGTRESPLTDEPRGRNCSSRSGNFANPAGRRSSAASLDEKRRDARGNFALANFRRMSAKFHSVKFLASRIPALFVEHDDQSRRWFARGSQVESRVSPSALTRRGERSVDTALTSGSQSCGRDIVAGRFVFSRSGKRKVRVGERELVASNRMSLEHLEPWKRCSREECFVKKDSLKKRKRKNFQGREELLVSNVRAR